MEIRRFFVDQADITDKQVVVSGEEFEHMTKVLRHKVGFKIIVCCSDGNDYNCTIDKIEKSFAVAKIDSVVKNQNDPENQIVLFQALPKGDKSQLIVQKCTELGVSKIIFFNSRYTEEKKFNRERLQRVAKEACKQSGRSVLCEVGELVDFCDILPMIREYECTVMPYENATCGKIGQAEKLKDSKKIAVIIGSEGGFSESEVEEARQNGAQIVSLGKRILRCETAGLVAIALIAYEKGELQR